MTLEQNPIFKGVKPWFWTKFEIPSQFVFFLIFLDILFGYLLDRKQGFQEYWNDMKEKSKIAIFPKGLTHGFGLKFKISTYLVFLWNITLDILFDYLLDR